MTRSLIADPEMPNRVATGKLDDIRACIGCNQACIGHFHMGAPVSCIQHPTTGRELIYGEIRPAASARRVLVIGGGPAGLKAAISAAEKGHRVTLAEAAERLGGQVLLAQLLPGRSEFGGLITNLEHEARRAGVEILLRTRVDRAWIETTAFEAIIVATGAGVYRPEIPGEDEMAIVDAWQLLRGEATTGNRVVIADWRADWVGMGLAEKLAREGCRVRLAVNGMCAGQEIQSYVRDLWTGTLHRLGVEILPYLRLYGADRQSVYLQHVLSGEAVVCDEVDTLVLALGHRSNTDLEQELAGLAQPISLAGDCLSPRSAEEAVFEGMKAGLSIQ